VRSSAGRHAVTVEVGCGTKRECGEGTKRTNPATLQMELREQGFQSIKASRELFTVDGMC
jgi:hypothetical protein